MIGLKNMNKKNKILIIGAGYVGMSLAVLLGKKNTVRIVDTNKKKVDLTASGRKRYYIDPKTGAITKGKEKEAVRTWLSRSLGKGYTTNPKMKGKQSPEFIKSVAKKIDSIMNNPSAFGETVKKIQKKYGFIPKVDPKSIPKVDVPKVDIPKGFKPTSPGNYTIPSKPSIKGGMDKIKKGMKDVGSGVSDVTKAGVRNTVSAVTSKKAKKAAKVSTAVGGAYALGRMDEKDAQKKKRAGDKPSKPSPKALPSDTVKGLEDTLNKGMKSLKSSKKSDLLYRPKRDAQGNIIPPKKIPMKDHYDWRETLDEKCWKGYEKKGMKTMFGKRYPNCVKKSKK